MNEEGKPKGHNARVDIPVYTLLIQVELEDLYNGAYKELSLQKNVICPKCYGTGGKLGKTKQCDQCHGRGAVLQDVDTGMGFSIRMQNTCPKCKGKGIVRNSLTTDFQ